MLSLKNCSLPIALTLFVHSTVLSANAEVLSINTTSSPPLSTSNNDGFQDLLTREIFQRLGFEIVIQFLPGERSLLNLDQGIDDATFVRIKGVDRKYKKIRMVPEKIMDWSFVGFTKKSDVNIINWKSLADYSVAYMNGWKIYENNVRAGLAITKVSKPKLLFSLLENGRTDIALFEKWSGLYLIKVLNLKDTNLLSPALATREMFMYVHQRHAAKVEELARIIREIKSDGSYQRFYDQTLGNLGH
jgi:polar amino acid transport system substrate-binding protein